MTTAQRIHALRRHGMEDQVIAAIIGVDPTDVAAFNRDPSAVPGPLPGGSGPDLTDLEGAAGDVLIGFRETGEAANRQEVHGDGTTHWGDGTNPADISVEREFAGGLTFRGINGGTPGVQIMCVGRATDVGGFWHRLDDDWTAYGGFGIDNSHVPFLEFQDANGVAIDLKQDPTTHGFSMSASLEILPHGGGVKLTSADGTKTKTLTIDNTGALALV